MSEAFRIIQDPTLTYRQELVSLARLGESTDSSLHYSDAYYAAKQKGALCDLNEGLVFVLHVALRRLDEVGDKVVAALELDVDLAPCVLDEVPHSDERVVDSEAADCRQNDESDKYQKNNCHSMPP